jgi:hypothetical protein
MATSKWIVMRCFDVDYDEPGQERRRHIPRFWRETEVEAKALELRLARAATIWHSLVGQPLERQPADYADHLANAEKVLTDMDPGAPSSSRYWVAEVSSYDGPTDDVTPVFTALMEAFAQLPNPPANVFEAVYRLIRDGGLAPQTEQ